MTTTYTGVLRDVNGAEIQTGHHLRPTVTLENDLGDPDKRYRNLYAGSTVVSSLKPVLTSVEIFGHLIPDGNNERDLGSSDERYKDVWGNVGKFYTLGAFGTGANNVLGLTGAVKMLDSSSFDMNRSNVTYTNAPWEWVQAIEATIPNYPGPSTLLVVDDTSYVNGFTAADLVGKDLQVIFHYGGALNHTINFRPASGDTLYASRILLYNGDDISDNNTDFNHFDAVTFKMNVTSTVVNMVFGAALPFSVRIRVFVLGG